MEKRALGPGIVFFPQPATWIATVDREGVIDLMTASWVGLVSKTPPTLGVSLHHNRQTYANIAATGCFTANVIPTSRAVEGDYCGLVSGRQADKLAAVDLTPVGSLHVAAPLLDESPLCLECRVSGEVELGDYRLVLGEILDIHIDAAACREQGYDAAAIDPLVYLGGIREYWSLGRKVGDAYSIGKELPEK